MESVNSYQGMGMTGKMSKEQLKKIAFVSMSSPHVESLPLSSDSPARGSLELTTYLFIFLLSICQWKELYWQ